MGTVKYNAYYRKMMRDWVASLKNKPCMDCGQSFHHSVMEWDHRPGEVKIASVSRLMVKYGKEAILAEIEKCDLVCANCHAFRTWQRAQNTE